MPSGAKRRGRPCSIDRRRAARLYRAGLSLTAIGAELGCSGEGVKYALISSGVYDPSRPRPRQRPRAWPRPRDREKVARVEELYRSGLTLDQVGAEVGWGRSQVYRVLKKLGVPTRSEAEVRNARRAPLRARVVELWDQGHTTTEAARMVGCGVGAAAQYVRQAGGDPRSHGLPGAGAALRSARQRAGLTQEALARRLGWNQARISDIERGRHVPTRRVRVELARALGLPEDALVPRRLTPAPARDEG